MVHLQAKALKVTVYTSDKYNDDQDSSDQNNKEFNSMQSEGAIPGSMLSPARESQRKQPESIIQMISDYVVFLLQSSVPNFNLQTMVLDADAEEISTIQSPEDFLVYSCLLAHKISNNEQIKSVKIPDMDQIKM